MDEPSLGVFTPEAHVMAARARGTGTLPTTLTPQPPARQQHCDCGQPWTKAAATAVAHRAGTACYLFHTSCITEVEIRQLRCQCGETLPYDGKSDAVFNVENVNFFTHELLNGCAHLGSVLTPPCGMSIARLT